MGIRRTPAAQTPPPAEAAAERDDVRRPSAPVEDDVDPGAPRLPSGEGVTFRARVEALQQIDPEAAKQLCLDTVFHYMLTRTAVHIVAERLGYSTHWVIQKRKEVRDRMREQAADMDVKSYLHETLEQLEEVAAIGFREAATPDTPARDGQAFRDNSARRLKGAEVARNAIRDRVAILQMSGGLDGAPLRPTLKATGDDPEAKATNLLKDLSEKFLARHYNREDIDEAGPNAKDVVVDQ